MRAVLDARPNAVRFIFICTGHLFDLQKQLVIHFANAKFCVVVFLFSPHSGIIMVLLTLRGGELAN